MNNRNVSKKINFSISPTNDSSMSVNAQGKLQGGYRFSGQNIIKFVIPAQDALLHFDNVYQY